MYEQVEQVLTMYVYVVTLKGWGPDMFAEYHYILHWNRDLLGNP